MNREIYATDGKITIYPVADEDRAGYTELHRQLNGEKSFFLNPLCKDMMWEQVLKGNIKIFSIYRNAGYCGSIELQNPESITPEIGIDLLECERNKGLAPKVIQIFTETVADKQNIDYYLVRISSKNKHSIHVFEKLGAVFDGEEESPFNRFIETFKSVMNDGIRDSFKKYFETDDDPAEEIIYRYKLFPKQIRTK